MESVLKSPEVLVAIVAKLDATAYMKRPGAEDGFHAFVGALWDTVYDRDSNELFLWLKTLFVPLLNRGSTALLAQYVFTPRLKLLELSLLHVALTSMVPAVSRIPVLRLESATRRVGRVRCGVPNKNLLVQRCNY
jgi:hypothetical protein